MQPVNVFGVDKPDGSLDVASPLTAYQSKMPLRGTEPR
jgi:hypothetical protein